ncbi:hypothetical protein [Bizionia myxarmorum]|uniref:Lipoprotein n=1 Tax=Bizionia myxarmorum TaxID=291186 RepID=A0A5D0RCM3_9FLAO|nr:hypothetical protein [Bizionia myxarmorum]TYB78799.1 hypothetical protein ES674_03200 [Bizionia myxarmorum]
MKNSLFILFIFALITSCSYGVDFEIQNNTNTQIDSLTITNGFNTVKIFDLKPQEIYKTFLDFKEYNPKQDGSFGVHVYSENSVRAELFGYYSNGIPLTKSYKLEIKKDTILVKSVD